MVDHWKHHGIPTYMALSGFLGLVKDKSPAKTGSGHRGGEQYGNLEELAAMFESSGGLIQ